ncbi:Heat shock protein [Aspergillus sp. HF37]|nr:Heat shock protein [Aspergillus sp. HF37]
MSLARHSPSYRGNEWGSLFRLLDDYNDHLTTRGTGLTAGSFTPRFDVRETKDAYHLDGELPGISQKEVDLEFTDAHTLVVKGSTQREHSIEPAEDREGSGPSHKYWATERSVGQFSRTLNFPARVDHDAVTANLKNGILNVTIPKGTPPSSKRIRVESE